MQKEWEKLEKQEAAYLEKRMEKTDSKLNQFLAKKVPAKLQSTLDAASLSYGTELEEINTKINYYIEKETHYKGMDIDSCIKEAAGCLSKELLYMKFLQGIPVVGVAGGAYDAVYMKQVVKYAEMKYQRRFYSQQGKEQKADA